MYNFDNISVSYEYSTCVTHHDGHKSSFRKVEHIKARRDNTGFLFTFNGTSEDTIDGKELEDWGAIFQKFASALYPYTLQVTADGKITGVQNFDKLKEKWIAQCNNIVAYYNYNVHVKNAASSYAETLKSERMFLSYLRRNVVFNLLFWNDDQIRHEVELQQFPTPKMITIFSFEGVQKNDRTAIFKTDSVYEERDNFLKGGDCLISICRDVDGLPKEIELTANVERLNYGFFKKEITLKRL